jgi:hypothetical protein
VGGPLLEAVLVSGAVKKRYRLQTVLSPKHMPTKVSPAKQAELARRTEAWNAKQDAKASKPK